MKSLKKLKEFFYKIIHFKLFYHSGEIDKVHCYKFFKNIFNYELNSIIEVFIKLLEYFNLLKFFSIIYNSPINKKIVCFSSMMGMEFIDNPKYLFLYLRSHSNYDCYWFTSSRNVYNKLKNLGYPVLYNYSFKAIKILKRAGYIITAWTINLDFLKISFSKESIIIHTWHGHQFKKILADVGRPIKNPEIYNYLISPGKNINKFLISAFQINPNKIIVTGLPRNDILFKLDEKAKRRLRQKYDISEKIKKIILYAPTFREYNLISTFPLTREELNELNDYLKETDTLLIYKSHFVIETEQVNILDNIMVVNKSKDPQELIIISDMLITDYSTIYFDFILIQKPAILFPYDLEEYIKYPGLYHNLEDIAVGPIVKTGKELIKALKTCPIWIKESRSRSREIRDKYWDYHDGKSCERFFNKINLKLK